MEVTEKLAEQTSALVAQAQALTIHDAASYETACGFLRDVKALRQEVANTFDPVVEKAHQAHKAAVAARKRHDEPLALAEATVKRSIGTYQIAEQQRLRAEQAQREAEALRQAEEAALAEAEALEAAGETEAAARVLDEPLIPVAAPPMPEGPKAGGVAVRERWRAEVVDLRALIQAVAAGQAPTSLLAVENGVLQGLARAHKAELRLPGVKVVRESTVAARASA